MQWGEGGARIGGRELVMSSAQGTGSAESVQLGEMCRSTGLPSYAGWARLEMGSCGP